MASASTVEQEFRSRVQTIRPLGLGLSVDLYQPDLFDLMERCSRASVEPGYLEVFRASSPALKAVRTRFPLLPLACHGEGLWITQPDFKDTRFVQEEVEATVCQLDVLGSVWLNHECATKQMAGYSFGTYLPPLYSEESARVVAENIVFVQRALDRLSPTGPSSAPLFLLELPPLTYFMAGTVTVPRFFRLVTDWVPCGIVLDIGHLWTLYRYTLPRHKVNLERFVTDFLDKFPLERVVEVHIAGLACHESSLVEAESDCLPEWVDTHAAPIREVTWAMLEQVLAHPRLVSLRGVALEVDSKSLDKIVEEFRYARARCGSIVDRACGRHRHEPQSALSAGMSNDHVVGASILDRSRLQEAYERYARIVSGRQAPDGPEWDAVRADPSGLHRYIESYLPYEILHWGGDLADMFTGTCRALAEANVPLKTFVDWWFLRARPVDRPYDYFLLKIDRFVEFVGERAPQVRALAQEEASLLRRAYADANEPLVSPVESRP